MPNVYNGKQGTGKGDKSAVGDRNLHCGCKLSLISLKVAGTRGLQEQSFVTTVEFIHLHSSQSLSLST